MKMNFEQLKKKILRQCEAQLEEISMEVMMEAEGETEGASFEFTIGEKTYNINVKCEYDEDKVEYIKEEYDIRLKNRF